MIKFLDIIGNLLEPIVKRTEPFRINLKALIIISGIVITILLIIILIKKINNSRHKE